MRSLPWPALNALLVAAAAMSPAVSGAADVVKANNATAISTGTSWVGGANPGAGEIALFDGTYATSGTLTYTGTQTWQGIRISSAGTQVNIANATSGQYIALGSGGIDMSAATVNAIIQRVRIDATQTWNIGSGRLLTIGNPSAVPATSPGTQRQGQFAVNAAGFTITKAGAGTVQLDVGNTALGSVNWRFEGGVVRAIWNGTSAWGSGTLTLAGGGIAAGTNFSGSVGNWTWNNAITLASGTTSFIDNQNYAGTGRWLKLESVISGSGNLEFRDTGAGFDTMNAGFILTGTNTFTGNLTIAANAEVRVGGAALNTQDDIAGNFGKLAADSVVVTNNGSLTFARLDSHTVANAIQGTGKVQIGLTANLGGSLPTSQVVTFTNTNTYSGGTELVNGTLSVAALSGIGGGYLAVKGGGTFLYTGSGSETTTRNVFLDSGAATFNISNASGALTLNPAGGTFGAAGTSFTKSGAGTLEFGGALGASSNQTVTVSAGRLRLTAANTFTGGVTISGGTMELSGAGSLGSGSYAGAIDNAGALEFTGSASQTLTGAITGVGSLSRSGSGGLTLSNTGNTYTGGTTVSNGTLTLGASNVLADTGAVAVSGGVLAIGANTETVGSLTLSGGSVTGSTGALTSATDVAVTNTAGTVTVSAILAGSAGLTKSGNGELVLGGANTYAGATAVNAGTASVSGSTGAVTVANGARLRGTGSVTGITLANGAIVEAGISGLGSFAIGNLSVAASSQATFNVLNVSNYTTNAAFAAGTLGFGSGGAIKFDVSGSAPLGYYNLLSYSGNITEADFSLVYSGLSGRTGAALNFETAGMIRYKVDGNQPKWTGTAAGWTTANAWLLTPSGGSTSFQASDAVIFDDSASAGQFAGSVSIASDVDPISLLFSADTLAYEITSAGGVITTGSLSKTGAALLTIGGANTFSDGSVLSAGRTRLAADAALGIGTITLGGAALSSDGVTARAIGNALLLSGNATLGDATDSGALGFSAGVDLGNANRSLTIASPVTLAGIVVNGGLTKVGNGTLTLSGANTYTGGTTVSAGTLALGASGVLADTGAVTVSGGTLALGSNNETIGAFTLTSGSLTGNGTLTIASATFDHNGSQSVSAVIAGAGSLTKAGNGALTLTGGNTYSGGTTLRSGTIVASGASALGSSGTVTVNDASTGSADTALLIDASAVNGTIARAITVANQGSGTVTLGALSNRADGSATFAGALVLGRDVTLTGGTVAGDRTQFTGGISGSGNLTVAGTTRVLFGTAANTYTGATTVLSGAILQLSDGSAAANSLLPDAATVTVNGTLNLAKNGNNETVGGLAGSGIIQALAGSDTLTVSSASNHTFSGVLRNNGGTLNLAKAGTGTLTLTGVNTYTGLTTLSAGKLVASGNLGAALTGPGELDFGANTIVIGNSTTASNQFFTGKLTGTGAIQLRGGSATIVNADGTTFTASSNFQIWTAATAVIQATSAQFFALDTGASATDRKDFGFINDTGDALNLKQLSGWGALRNDAGGTNGSQVIRQIVVDQATDTVFNGALLSHRSTGNPNAIRSVRLTKKGSGSLELAGFIGKATASAAGGDAPVYLNVEAGTLTVTNPLNTTTTNTDAIRLNNVTVTGGTLGFAAQALVNNAGTVGAAQILLDGGTLRWNAGNTQDISLGGRLRLVSGKAGNLDIGDNDVILSAALGGAADASLVKVGSGVLTMSGPNTYSGGTTVTGGKLRAGSTAAFGTGTVTVIGGILDVGGQTLANAITLAGGSLEGSGTLSGTVSVVAGFTKSDAGSLTLSGTNAFASVAVVDGVLIAGSSAALGSGLVTVSGGTLDVGGQTLANAITLAGGALAGSGTLSGTVTAASGLTKSGAGSLTLSGTNAIASVAINQGTLVAGSVGAFGSGAITLGGGTLDVGGQTLANAIILQSGSLAGSGTLAGSLSGAGNLTKSGSGVLELSGANSYAATTVSGGTLRLSGTGTLGTGAVTVSGGTLDLNAVALTKDITLSSGTLTGASALVGTVSLTSNAAANGTLSGNLSLGTVVSRTLDITGGLTVEGTLSGTGTLANGALTIAGTHSPGNSPGYQLVNGDLTYGAGATLNWEFDDSDNSFQDIGVVRSDGLNFGNYDAIDVAGNLIITPGAFLSITGAFVDPGFAYQELIWEQAGGVTFQLIKMTTSGSISGMFQFANGTQTEEVAGLGTWTVRLADEALGETKGIYLTYTAIPEPSTYGLLLGGLALAAAAARRRRLAKQPN